MSVSPVDQTTRMYCSVPDVLTRIDKRELPGANLEHLIRTVTARVERFCDRVFTRVPATGTEEREFMGEGSVYLMIDDLLSLSSLTIDDESQDTDDFWLMPLGKTPTTWLEWQTGQEWSVGSEVAITGAWGYSEKVPWEIWNVTVAWVVRELERAKVAYQDAGAVPELGQLVYAKAIPADIREVLKRYRKMPF